MADLDLDAWEAARAEKAGDGPTIEFRGRTWVLPALAPGSMLEFLIRPRDVTVDLVVRDLFGDQYDEFMGNAPPSTTERLQELLDGVVKVAKKNQAAYLASGIQQLLTGEKSSRPSLDALVHLAEGIEELYGVPKAPASETPSGADTEKSKQPTKAHTTAA